MNKLIQNKTAFLVFIISFFTITGMGQAPVINSFSPLSASIGSSVIISGSNFDATPANNIVFFGASKAVVTSASANSLDVIVPPGASYEPVSVNVNGLTCFSSLKFTTIFDGSEALESTSFEMGGKFPPAYTSCWAIADLDGDGKPDLGTHEPGYSLYYSDTIYIYRNTSANGILSYEPGLAVFIPIFPNDGVSIFFKDIDGDGKADLVTFTPMNKFSVFRNTSTPGNLSFAEKISLNYWGIPGEAIWGDFDNDGKIDAGLLTNGSLGIFLNTSSPGNISFNPNEAFSTSLISKIKIADIDEDGKIDLIVASGTTLQVFKNNSSAGSVSFTHTDLPLLSASTNLFIGDLDADQKEDIVSMAANGFSIFKNISTPGSPAFASRDDRTINGYNSIGAFSFNDMDGDGKPDLVGKVTIDSMGIFSNTGTGGNISFAPYVAYPGQMPAPIASNLAGFADLNLDGKSDILIAQASDYVSSIGYLKNRIAEPRIISFTPTAGGAGTSIHIAGYNLGTTNSITIGATPVSSFNVVDPNNVSAVVAAGSAGRLLLTTTYGKDSIDAFNSPVIKSFTPVRGGPFTEITIKGFNFTGATVIAFAGIQPASFTVTSDTTISALIGDSAASGAISVTNPFGTVSRSGFIFYAPNKIELCPPTASTSFTVSIGNYSQKKWQVYNGSTYVDVVNDAHYSGSNTTTLQLNNIPSSWNGNHYQFLYGNSASSLSILNQGHFLIRFVNRWNGSASTAWEDPANWSCGTVPDSGTDVIINSGAVITLNSNTTIRSLTISPSATLTIATGANLTILH